MKQKTFKQRCIKFALIASTTALLLPVFILFSFKSKFENFSDIWKQLGITEKMHQEISGKVFYMVTCNTVVPGISKTSHWVTAKKLLLIY